MMAQPNDTQNDVQERDTSSACDIFLKSGYAEADIQEVATILLREHVRVSAEAAKYDLYGDINPKPNREDYFLAAFRLHLQQTCEKVLSCRHRNTSEMRMLDAYKVLLTNAQRSGIVEVLEDFYHAATIDQRNHFWVILEGHANGILSVFRRAQSARNKGILLYCLSMMFSKSALAMHDASVKSISGNGGLECDILLRELKGFKKQNSYTVRAAKNKQK